jgi:hypothetical protein
MTGFPQKRKYILDANVLFGFSLWLPIELNREFWATLEESLRRGDWVLLDVVVGEVKFDNGGLKKWCEKQSKNGLVKNISDDHKNRAIEINNTYKMIDEFTQKSTVDTFLIAYAEEQKLVVFSREGRRINENGLYKIPDVCDILKIQVTRSPKVFLEAIGYKS